jgi:hypothetical protein
MFVWIQTGVPDEILEKQDGSYVVVDYKTVRPTSHQDELLRVLGLVGLAD